MGCQPIVPGDRQDGNLKRRVLVAGLLDGWTVEEWSNPSTLGRQGSGADCGVLGAGVEIAN